MDGITLRPLTLDDVEALVAIERVAFSDPWTASAFKSMLVQPQVIATAADDGESLIGYSIAWAIGDEAELANLAVVPAHQGRGIGSRLLDTLLDELGTRGGATVYLEVRASNVAAQGLYASRGFSAVGRRKAYYRRPTEDAVVMKRDAASGPGREPARASGTD